VTISCLVSDLVFEWRLSMLDGGAATSITVHVEIPEAEAHRLAAQQEVISQSLSRLAALAAAESRLPVQRAAAASSSQGPHWNQSPHPPQQRAPPASSGRGSGQAGP
jgi:hypothetical protein